jgi:hypothetical protein
MLHKDRPALKTTSLVCRNWLPASRMHLFEMVTFSPVNLTDFFSISNSRYSTLLPHIRNITLKPPGVLPHQGQYQTWKNFTPDLHRCTAIKSVSLEYMKWHYLEPSARESFVSNLPGVTEINTISATFANLGQLLELLASYPLLEKVSLDFGLSSSSLSLSPPLHPFPPRLGTIKLGAQHTQHVLTWLQSHDTFPDVHTLDIYNIRPIEVGPLERLLRVLGPQLKHLHVAFITGSRILSESAAGAHPSQTKSSLNLILFSCRYFSSFRESKASYCPPINPYHRRCSGRVTQRSPNNFRDHVSCTRNSWYSLIFSISIQLRFDGVVSYRGDRSDFATREC